MAIIPAGGSVHEDSLGCKETLSQKEIREVGCGGGSAGKAFAACKHEDCSADPSTHINTGGAWQPTCNFSNREEETGVLEKASWLD